MGWPQSVNDRIREEVHFGDRKVKCFSERPSDVNAMVYEAVCNRADYDAVVAGDRRLSYAQLNEQVSLLAAGMIEKGVNRGDRVAMLLGNRIEFLTVLLATLRIGAIAVPVNTREQTPELTYILNHCGAVLLVFEKIIEDKLPAMADLDSLQFCYVTGGESTVAESLTALSATQAPVFSATEVSATEVSATEPSATELCATEHSAPVAEEDVAVILYTSGTTGRPKGAMLTHFNIVHSVMHFELCMQLNSNDRSMLAVPASHVTGIIAILATMLRVGGCTVMMDVFDASRFLSIAAQEKVTHTVIVPAMYNLILLRCNTDDYDLSTLRIGAYGGAPMPQSTIAALAEKLPQLLLVNAYGSTEATSPVTLLPPGTGSTRSDSVGIAVPCADVRIVDEHGHDVPDGTDGELWIAGPMMVPGYWNDADKTNAEFTDGYWKSGDIGSRDSDGFYCLHDRRKDMIIRGGYNVYSAEVENVVAAMDDVIECAVIGRADPVLGEKIEVVVVVSDNSRTSSADIVEYCHARVADYKVPDIVTFSTQPLPRNANGKVIKRVLREKPPPDTDESR